MKRAKPISSLTVGDLDRYPIWTFVDELTSPKMDETWVVPLPAKVVPRKRYSLNVRARFMTVGGRVLNGFMDVATARRKVEISPGAVVGPFGYCVLPTVSRAEATRKKLDWSLTVRERFCKALRRREPEVFPVHYLLCIPIDGEEFLRGGVVA